MSSPWPAQQLAASEPAITTQLQQSCWLGATDILGWFGNLNFLATFLVVSRIFLADGFEIFQEGICGSEIFGMVSQIFCKVAHICYDITKGFLIF